LYHFDLIPILNEFSAYYSVCKPAISAGLPLIVRLDFMGKVRLESCKFQLRSAALPPIIYRKITTGNTVTANTTITHSMPQRSKWPEKCKNKAAIATA
jgi:hypothetical protein